MEASHRLLYVSFKSYSQHLDNIKRNFCSFITTFLWVTEVCVYFRECVLTGGHLQMKPCGVLLATAQVPPLRQGLLLQPSNTVSQRWPTEVSHTKRFVISFSFLIIIVRLMSHQYVLDQQTLYIKDVQQQGLTPVSCIIAIWFSLDFSKHFPDYTMVSVATCK